MFRENKEICGGGWRWEYQGGGQGNYRIWFKGMKFRCYMSDELGGGESEGRVQVGVWMIYMLDQEFSMRGGVGGMEKEGRIVYVLEVEGIEEWKWEREELRSGFWEECGM